MAKNKQELEAELKTANDRIAEVEKRLAAGQATAELADGVEIQLERTCGALQEGVSLGVVLLAPGVDLNFLVDAVRSNVARPVVKPEAGDEAE